MYSNRQYILYRSRYRHLRLLTRTTAAGDCKVEVSLTGPLVQANWYAIQGSAVSIMGTCVRSSEEGVSVGEGGCLLFATYMVVHKIDTIAAAGTIEITVRVSNQSLANLFETVA